MMQQPHSRSEVLSSLGFERATTTRQQGAMKMRVQSFQYMQAASLLLSFVVIFIGTIINHHDHKFARSYNTSCSRGILILNAEDSHVCCDAHTGEFSWVCAASFDPFNKILSSALWAFVIPLLPFFLTVLLNRQASLKLNLRRLGVYAGIFAFRTVCIRSEGNRGTGDRTPYPAITIAVSTPYVWPSSVLTPLYPYPRPRPRPGGAVPVARVPRGAVKGVGHTHRHYRQYRQ
jgi:hypothetical protein